MGKQAFYQLGVLGARLTGFMLAQRDAARMLTHTGPAGAVPERDTLRDRGHGDRGKLNESIASWRSHCMFSPDALIAKIDAAEQLAAKIDTLDGEQKTLCIYRWAIVADEATGLAICAEEVLSPAELANLQKRLQKNGADLWARYRDNPRRFKQITGSEPWEQT